MSTDSPSEPSATSTPSASTDPPSPSDPSPTPAGTTRRTSDPLRGSRTSGIWIGVLALAILLLLLAVFIIQNTQKVEISYFGWSGRAPLAASLLIAAVAGALAVAASGMLRILQLRRRVKRERKR